MKLINIIAVILLMILMTTCISASENFEYHGNSTNITFEGVDFIIPEGFAQSKDDENFDGLGSDGKTCFYVNESDGEIQITVISDWMGMNLDELYKDGAEKSTVNGHEGWNYTENDLHYFGYVEDDTGILIGVTNETKLFEIIL